MTHETEGSGMTTEQAIARLRSCRDLVQRVDQSGQGILYQPSETELTLLHGYEAVVNAAAERPDVEGWVKLNKQG